MYNDMALKIQLLVSEIFELVKTTFNVVDATGKKDIMQCSFIVPS